MPFKLTSKPDGRLAIEIEGIGSQEVAQVVLKQLTLLPAQVRFEFNKQPVHRQVFHPHAHVVGHHRK